MSIEDYVNLWPSEIKGIQEALQTDLAIGIFSYLLTEDSRSFSEISSSLDVQQNKLAYHLKQMTNKGLIENKLGGKIGSRGRSYYTVSPLGKIYARKMLEIVTQLYSHKFVKNERIVEDASFLKSTPEKFEIKEIQMVGTSNHKGQTESRMDCELKGENVVSGTNLNTKVTVEE